KPAAAKPSSPPPPPSHDAFSSGLLPGDSGAFTDDDDPFFTGDPERMSELGSITHGDASQFGNEVPAARSGIREFEFEDDGASIELGDLELTDTAASSAAELPTPVRRRADISAPDFAGLNLSDDDGGFANADDFDLPAPVQRPATSSDPQLVGSARDLDLPAPVGRAPLPDLPSPARPSPGVDRSAPIEQMSLDDGCAFDDLPMPADDDFPAPPIDDFPAPNIDDLDGFDALPTSADVLPTAIDDLPIPAKAAVRDLPRSADILPTPVETLGLDLDLDDDRSAHRPPPKTGPTATADGAPKPPSKASPAVVATERPRRDIARYVVYGVLGLAVLVLGGG